MAEAAVAEQNQMDLVIHLTPKHVGNYLVHEVPDKMRGTPLIVEDIDIGGGAKVRAVLVGTHLFVGPENTFPWTLWGIPQVHEGPEPLVRVLVRGTAHPKVVTQEYAWWPSRTNTWSGHSSHQRKSVTQADCYLPEGTDHHGCQFDPNDPKRLPYAYLGLDLAFPNGEVHQVEWKFRIPRTGKVTIGRHACGRPKLDVDVDFHGFTHQFTEGFDIPKDAAGNDAYMRADQTPVATLYRHLTGSTIVGGKDALWAAFLGQWHDDTKTPTDNIASVYKRKALAPSITRLEKEQPLDWTFFRWLHNTATAGGKRNNQLLSAMLQEVGEDYDRLLGALRTAREGAVKLTTDWTSYRPEMKDGLPVKRAICETLPGVAEKIQEIEATKDFRKQKTAAGQAGGLGVTATYPLLRAAIEGGKIPIGVFNQPGKDGQPVNREFSLWERALSLPGWAEVLYEIAQNAAGRGTYERDITPYLMFLFRLPAYLNRHAPRAKSKGVWTAKPKFVQSQWELERDDADDDTPNGTVKKRSAFTPVADNETGVVEVPYVAVCVTGVRTQWCYSRHFYIFEEGFTDPESGGGVLRDLEPKLNGRDDYGLCYYTLTGTDTARGYPTFLIIFEKRQGHTEPNRNGDSFPKTDLFVHFHRVRPCRSKDGVKTPACNLIEACYQYMAGNIPAADITAQQGDIIFIKMGHDPLAAKAKVADDPQTSPTLVFESHALQSLNPDVALTLHRSTAKTPQNRLGFVWAPSGLRVGHPEHDDIEHLSEGWYEIRRCKSWEANPKAIWSLTID